MRVEPIRKDSLLGSAKLARPAEHSASIHPYREPERGAVFDRHDFGREFCSSINRDRLADGELFRESARRSHRGATP